MYFLRSALPNEKVFIAGINQKSSSVVCANDIWQDRACQFHTMDSYSRFSAVIPVKSSGLTEAVVGFGIISINQFWQHDADQIDLSFHSDECQSFLGQYDIAICPASLQRHHKNFLEPKHGVIRLIR